MSSDFTELDRIWPLGQQLVVPENGVIFVAGAYHGRYCDYLSHRFPAASIYGFEPQRAAFNNAVIRCHSRPNVELFNFGIAITTSPQTLGDCHTDGASLLKDSGYRERCYFLDSPTLRRFLGVEHIDLLLLNIEGYEWPLLKQWLSPSEHEIEHYRSLAVQFHIGKESPSDGCDLIDGLTAYYGRPEYFDYPDWCWFAK